MFNVLVLYYSMYGNVETRAGQTVGIKRLPETVSREVVERCGEKLDVATTIASPKELADLHDDFWFSCAIWEYGRADALFP